ncbi:hypothetical protein [Bradyrhizobium sp. NP1]|uniref:hypothetical protein n=1 Tax=Bradyrhizobium sp. NP1 TaxID=3049772 RepID=UPI0025A63AC2|nr:hypothetical protein [Bradyrhizobium sp. NP1]WJR76972.1 hypothetical protein QOU61_30160 [Bradyrhizobium sp. NP1]
MWRFGKTTPKEVWDEPIAGPIGDIAAAERIRNICRSAADSAEQVAGSAGGPDARQKSDQAKRQRESERYERAARAAMEIAMKISDDLMRDSAVAQIVDLCAKANDMKTARILFRAIQAETIRTDVTNAHPALRL